MSSNKHELEKISKEEQEIISYFANEEEELKIAINEIDDLYTEVKTHYDELKCASRSANGGRGILTFIEKQTSNLVSLKSAKSNLINNKITVKKYAAELALKQKKDDNDSKVNNDIVDAILAKLDKQEENSVIVDMDEEEEVTEKNIDKILEKRIKSLKESGDIIEEETDNNGQLAIYVKDKKWHFIGLNESGKIIKGFEVPDKKDYKMKLHKEEDGSYTATDQSDKVYKVIKKK